MSFLQAQIDLKGAQAILRHFARWWLAELRALVPICVRRLLATDARRLSIALAEDGFETRIGTPYPDGSLPALAPVSHADWDGLLRRLRAEKRRWGGLLMIAVRVPIASCLVRERVLPARALGNAEGVLRLELQQATPFALDDVYWNWLATTPKTSDSVTVRQLVLKRSRIDPLLRALEQNGLPPIAIEIEDDAGRLLPTNLLPGGRHLSTLEARLRKVLVASAAILALLAIVAAGMAIYRQQELLGELEAEQQRLTKKAADVRHRLAGAEAALAQARQVRLHKSQSTTFVQIWEELTRLLPDTAWVTELRLDGGTLAIDGYAASASELIGVLAGSRFWKDVAFASPVTRDAQRSVERFQIRMLLERTAAQGDRPVTPRP
jgi:general secretion pathway protein L